MSPRSESFLFLPEQRELIKKKIECGYWFEFSSASTDVVWCNHYKKQPVFCRGWGEVLRVSSHKHGGKCDFLPWNVLYSDTKWDDKVQNSFSLHFLFDPSVARSRQASSSSPPPPVLPSCTTSRSTIPLLRLNSLSALGHSYDSSVCHIQDARQTDSQSPSLSPESESQFGAGRLIHNQAICAVCTPSPSTVGSLLHNGYFIAELINMMLIGSGGSRSWTCCVSIIHLNFVGTWEG